MGSRLPMIRLVFAVLAAVAMLRPGGVQAETRTAALPGVTLSYVDTGGAGPAVIFVHALTGTSASWAKQADVFATAGYRVIAFDRRGWGQSIPDPATGPQPGTVTEDIDALATHLRIAKFHLVGIAGGGFVALDYAAWRPERLLSLVVAASTGAVSETAILDFSRRIEIPGVTWPSLHLEVGPSFIGADADGTARWEAIADHARRPGAVQQPLRSPNTYAKIASIKAPTLLIAGGADLLAPPGLMRVWAGRLPSYEWHEVSAAGHSINWESPDEFNRAVLGFLRKH